MASGGARQGTPGKGYPNRTDMAANRQPIQAPTGLGYGERKALEDAQRAVPVSGVPVPPAAPQATGIAAPTARPDEPVTHGLPVGPGGGPEVLGQQGYLGIADDTELELRSMLAAFPQYANSINKLLDYYRQ